MSSALDLVVLNGPHESEVVQLSPDQSLRLGRSAKGFQLVDPLVSLAHAEITWEGDRYWVEDIGSATGTFVNDVRLTDKAVCLVPGMRVRLGETVMEVRPRPKSHVLRIAGGVAAIFLLGVAATSLVRAIDIEYDPHVNWFREVNQWAGFKAKRVVIPTDWIRTYGVDHRGLRFESVEDLDGDGVDEIWLRWDDGRAIVTFTEGGGWRTISEIPMNCEKKPVSLADSRPECRRANVATPLPEGCEDDAEVGFPDSDCGGLTYRYAGDGYDIVGLDGVAAWMDPTEVVDDPDRSSKKVKVTKVIPKTGPPIPYLFTLSGQEHLAGFLADRGVYGRIHYLICETAFDGLRAQVLTEDGEIVPLDVGCIDDVDLAGATRGAEYGTFTPHMFAFTGHGYQALLDDVAVWMSGGTDGLFMDRRDAAVHRALSASPQRRQGAIRVLFDGPEVLTNPIAAETLEEGRRRLQPTEFGRPSEPFTSELLITKAGRYPLEGCGTLEVRSNDWHCVRTKGCSASSAFMTMQTLGCAGKSRKVVVPYTDGIHPFKDGQYVGRVEVDTYGTGQIDVLRVRFAYQLPDDD